MELICVLWSIGAAVSYIAAIYGSSWLASPKQWTNRNHPPVLIARSIALLALSLLIVYIYPIRTISRVIYWEEVRRVCILFLPLLLAKLLIWHHEWKNPFHSASPLMNFSRLLGISRDFIIAPISEEIVFRHLILGRFLGYRSATLAAAIFSLLHAHPLLVVRGVSKVSALIQCCFTFAFGLLVGNIFQRTDSVLTCIVVHSLANAIGFPDLDVMFMQLPIWQVAVVGFASGYHLIWFLWNNIQLY